jgi:hypothetical protein
LFIDTCLFAKWRMGSGRRPDRSLRIRGKEKKTGKYSQSVYRLVGRRRPQEVISLCRDNIGRNVTLSSPISTQYVRRKPGYKIDEAFERIIWCSIFREII